jgi:hypothetical protein
MHKASRSNFRSCWLNPPAFADQMSSNAEDPLVVPGLLLSYSCDPLLCELVTPWSTAGIR